MKLLTRAEVESGWLPDDVEGIEYGRRADATILRAVELLRKQVSYHNNPTTRGIDNQPVGECQCAACEFLRAFDGEEQAK